MEEQILVKVEISDETNSDLEKKCEWCSELIPKDTNIQGKIKSRGYKISTDIKNLLTRFLYLYNAKKQDQNE